MGSGRDVVRRTLYWAAVAVMGTLLSLASGCAAPIGEDQRPNIVLFLVDDLGWRDVGFMGSSYHETPHIDSIAAQGMVFSHAYANAPNCAPSRAALMSGMYAPRTGVYTVSPPDRGRARDRRLVPAANVNFIEPEVITIAERLRGSGYATCISGKWHIGRHDGPTGPIAQGFDRNIGGYRKGHPDSYFSPYGNPALQDGPDGEYLTDRLTDDVVAFLEEPRDEPFFLYFPYYTVHTPIQPRPDLLSKTQTRAGDALHDHAGYAAMVAALDESVGRVLDALDRIGASDNTLVVFSSDNGGHGGYTRMDPLRGSKGMMWEGGTRVPFAARWPGRIAPGTASDVPIMLFDLYPTFSRLGGSDLPADQPIDGVSLIPILNGKTMEERPIFWHFPAYLQKYGFMSEPWRATPSSAVRLGDFKLIESFETETVMLFNLIEDPGEVEDLADKMPEKRDQLLGILREWQSSVGAPREFEANPRYRP
ncbi:MAG: sulfatase [Planctomycetota bacterium]